MTEFFWWSATEWRPIKNRQSSLEGVERNNWTRKDYDFASEFCPTVGYVQQWWQQQQQPNRTTSISFRPSSIASKTKNRLPVVRRFFLYNVWPVFQVGRIDRVTSFLALTDRSLMWLRRSSPDCLPLFPAAGRRSPDAVVGHRPKYSNVLLPSWRKKKKHFLQHQSWCLFAPVDNRIDPIHQSVTNERSRN